MHVPRTSLAAVVLVVVTGCLFRSPSSSTFPGGRGAGALSKGSAPARPKVDQDVLGDLTLLWKARDARAAGDASGVRTAATTLARQHADSVWAGDVYLLAGLAARSQGDLEETRRWLAEALPRLDDTTPQWRRAAVVFAETSVRLGDEQTALRLAGSLREKHPRGVADRRARRLTDRVVARRPDLAGTPEQQLEEATLR